MILKNLRISAKGGTYPTGMRNRSNFAKGNRFSARQGSQPLGSREFRARAAALNGYLAEIAALYTRPAGGLFPAGHFFSVILMYSFSMNFTCFVKSLSFSSAIFCIFSCRFVSNLIVFVIVSFFMLFILCTSFVLL